MIVSTSWSALHLIISSKSLQQLLHWAGSAEYDLRLWTGSGIEVQQRGETCLVICSIWFVISEAIIYWVVNYTKVQAWEHHFLINTKILLGLCLSSNSNNCFMFPPPSCSVHSLFVSHFLSFDALIFEHILFSLHIPNLKMKYSP